MVDMCIKRQRIRQWRDRDRTKSKHAFFENIPKCVYCKKDMELVSSIDHDFFGYRCHTHTQFYCTSLFFEAVADIYPVGSVPMG